MQILQVSKQGPTKLAGHWERPGLVGRRVARWSHATKNEGTRKRKDTERATSSFLLLTLLVAMPFVPSSFLLLDLLFAHFLLLIAMPFLLLAMHLLLVASCC